MVPDYVQLPRSDYLYALKTFIVHILGVNQINNVSYL